MVEDLAPQYPKTDKGWIQFPRDTQYRQSLFPKEVMSHPAKMQLYLIESLVEAYTKPGDKVLDPFGGTGSTAVAALKDRQVWLCELEPGYIEMLKNLLYSWHTDRGVMFTILEGDCRQTLKEIEDNFFDLVITSPPYPHFSYKAKSGPIAERAQGGAGIDAYKGGSMNFSRITNRFMFNRLMQKVYEEIHRVLKPGGHYVSVTKDSMEGDQRILLSMEIIRLVQEAGLKYTGDWFKWDTPGGLGNALNRSKGRQVVDDEDVIVFAK